MWFNVREQVNAAYGDEMLARLENHVSWQELLVVAVLDGRVPDEGVCVELGIAFSFKKTVVGVLSDSRTCFPWGLNPMVSGCLSVVCTDFAHLLEVVDEQIIEWTVFPCEGASLGSALFFVIQDKYLNLASLNHFDFNGATSLETLLPDKWLKDNPDKKNEQQAL